MAAATKGLIRVDIVSDTVWYVLVDLHLLPPFPTFSFRPSVHAEETIYCYLDRYMHCSLRFVVACSPWCFIGKRRLETAIRKCQVNMQARLILSAVADFRLALSSDHNLKLQGQKSFEVRWHPFFLNPNAPKEGVSKMEMYNQKFGEQRVKQMVPTMTVRQSCFVKHVSSAA